MSVFLLIVISIPIADVLWWRWADRRARRLGQPRIWRGAIAMFCALQLLGFVWILIGRFIGARPLLPGALLAPIYLWHLLVLPATWFAIGLSWLVRLIRQRLVGAKSKAAETAADNADHARSLSRRDVLAGAAIAIPPLLTAGTVLTAISQLDEFRINRMTIPLRRLPRELDGMTIAHVSDIHIGRFTTSALLPRLADATNALRADLVLLTGDLIDYSMQDLPAGIEFLRKLDPRSGIATIEGNHDLFEDREGFERIVASSGVPILLNDARMFRVRGIDVQILGMKWGTGQARGGGAMVDEHARETLRNLNPDPRVFPILLSHHPHAFDRAIDARIPLTLAGHTHGGQLMLTRSIGPGPLMYRYWSGLYQRGESALVVSNGVGNWFPLRINAPAEVVHITLRCAIA